MSIAERIRKASAELSLEELRLHGILLVAQPHAVAAKITKYTGIEVVVRDDRAIVLKDAQLSLDLKPNNPE